jgi:hypothetical protein
VDPVVVVSQGTDAASASESAPDVSATEQNEESSESDTKESEAKEDAKDESEDDADEESEESKDDAKDKPKKKGGFQRRIDKLNARHAQAQAELDYWKQLALKEKASGEPKVEKPPVNTAKAPQEGKPDPEAFESHAEYVEALTDWKLEQRDKARSEQDNRAKLQTEQQRVITEHTERVKSFAGRTEDFQDVLEAVDDVHVSAAVQEMIVTSENGPELMYELAKNRAEFERINALSPLAAARELGRIESRLSKPSEEKKAEPKKLTKAPRPPTPVGSSRDSVEKSIYDPALSQREYEAIRAKQLQRQG